MPSDTFTGTDGTPLATHDANWVAALGSFQLLSNGVHATSGSPIYAYWAGAANAHYSKATILYSAGSGNYGTLGPAVRCQSGDNFFYCYADVSGAPAGNVYNGECLAGASTDWDSGQAATSSGDVVELSIDSGTTTTIYYKVNGSTVATYTSKSALTGGTYGIDSYQPSNGDMRLDDWEGGDVGGAAYVRPRIIRSRWPVTRASRY